MRAPLIPIGCPTLMPPPRTLTLSRSNFSSRSQAITWAANASLISIRSMSAIVSPVRSSTFWVAGTGPIPMISGGTPAQLQPMIRASGMRPSARARSSSIRTMAAAPSVSPLELPAVTLPPSRKTGGSFARLSIVVSGLGCSSAATVRGVLAEADLDGDHLVAAPLCGRRGLLLGLQRERVLFRRA